MSESCNISKNNTKKNKNALDNMAKWLSDKGSWINTKPGKNALFDYPNEDVSGRLQRIIFNDWFTGTSEIMSKFLKSITKDGVIDDVAYQKEYDRALDIIRGRDMQWFETFAYNNNLDAVQQRTLKKLSTERYGRPSPAETMARLHRGIKNKLQIIRDNLNRDVEKFTEQGTIREKVDVNEMRNLVDRYLGNDEELLNRLFGVENLKKEGANRKIDDILRNTQEGKVISILEIINPKLSELIQETNFLGGNRDFTSIVARNFGTKDILNDNLSYLKKAYIKNMRRLKELSRTIQTFAGAVNPLPFATQSIQSATAIQFAKKGLIDSQQDIDWLAARLVDEGLLEDNGILSHELGVATRVGGLAENAGLYDSNAGLHNIFSGGYSANNIDRAMQGFIAKAKSRTLTSTGDLGDELFEGQFQVTAYQMAIKSLGFTSVQERRRYIELNNLDVREEMVKVKGLVEDVFSPMLKGGNNIRGMGFGDNVFRNTFGRMSSFGLTINIGFVNALVKSIGDVKYVLKDGKLVEATRPVEKLNALLNNPAFYYPIEHILRSAYLGHFMMRDKDRGRDKMSRVEKMLAFLDNMSVFSNFVGGIYANTFGRIAIAGIRGADDGTFPERILQQIGKSTLGAFGNVEMLLRSMQSISDKAKGKGNEEDGWFDVISDIVLRNYQYSMRGALMEDPEYGLSIIKKSAVDGILNLNNIEDLELKKQGIIAQRLNNELNGKSLISVLFESMPLTKVISAVEDFRSGGASESKFARKDINRYFLNDPDGFYGNFLAGKEGAVREMASKSATPSKVYDAFYKAMFEEEVSDFRTKTKAELGESERYLRIAAVDTFGSEENFQRYMLNMDSDLSKNGNKLGQLLMAYGKTLAEVNPGTDQMKYTALGLATFLRMKKDMAISGDAMVALEDGIISTPTGIKNIKRGDSVPEEWFFSGKGLKQKHILQNQNGMLVPVALSKKESLDAVDRKKIQDALVDRYAHFLPQINMPQTAELIIGMHGSMPTNKKFSESAQSEVLRSIEVMDRLRKGQNITLEEESKIARLPDRIYAAVTNEMPAGKIQELKQKEGVLKVAMIKNVEDFADTLGIKGNARTMMTTKMFLANKTAFLEVAENPEKYPEFQDEVDNILGRIYQTNLQLNNEINDYLADEIQTGGKGSGGKGKSMKVNFSELKPFKDFTAKNLKLLQNKFELTNAKRGGDDGRGRESVDMRRGMTGKYEPALSQNQFGNAQSSKQAPTISWKRPSAVSKRKLARFSIGKSKTRAGLRKTKSKAA